MPSGPLRWQLEEKTDIFKHPYVRSSGLSGDIGLEGLLHYTSATALLRFTNGAGERVYIDPFRVTEVSLTTLQSLNASADPRPDAARRSRIESQWAEFLNPSETTTNR